MLKIEKNKILYCLHRESKSYRNLTKIKGGIFRKMNDNVEIADNVTFSDFFKLLIKEEKLINVIFGASLYGVPFELLIKDFKKKSERKREENQFVEIFWHVVIDEDGLYVGPSLQSIEVKTENEKIAYGLEFTPLSELKDYQLKLNKDLEINDYRKILGSGELILKTTKNFSLYEIIHAILYDLTWYGTPEMRDKELKSICEHDRDDVTLYDELEFKKKLDLLRKEK